MDNEKITKICAGPGGLIDRGLYKLLSVMESHVSRDDKYSETNWDANTVVLENGLLKVYTSFSFIVAFVATMNAMSVVKLISIRLQFQKMTFLTL